VERWGSVEELEDFAGAPVLAFEAASVAGVLVLAVFADVVRWAAEIEIVMKG